MGDRVTKIIMNSFACCFECFVIVLGFFFNLCACSPVSLFTNRLSPTRSPFDSFDFVLVSNFVYVEGVGAGEALMALTCAPTLAPFAADTDVQERRFPSLSNKLASISCFLFSFL